MLLPVKPVCKTSKARKDGTSIIFIQYCYNGDKRILLNSGIAIQPSLWNCRKLQIIDSFPEKNPSYNPLNEQLQCSIRLVEDLITLARKKKIEEPLSFVKKYFSPGLTIREIEKDFALNEKSRMLADVYKNDNIYFQIDDYISSKIRKVSQDMPRIYKNMKEHLLDFEKFRGEAITFNCLDFSFYEAFVDFLMYDYVQKRSRDKIVGLKINTVGKTIKQLRTFLRNRIRKQIIQPVNMDGWIILEEEVDAVYLSRIEIKEIQHVDLSHHAHLNDYRNDFVLGCLTGLRFSDFSKLNENDIRGDMLYKKQQKSDHWVVIPLCREAKIILDNRFKKNISPLTNAEFNRHIKTILKIAGINNPIKHSYKKGNKHIAEIKPKHDWVTSHTCRRSFCTNEFLDGTPVELIMKISGHKSVKDFYKYIRISPEEAAFKIKEIWITRDQTLMENCI